MKKKKEKTQVICAADYSKPNDSPSPQTSPLKVSEPEIRSAPQQDNDVDDLMAAAEAIKEKKKKKKNKDREKELT